MYHKPKHYGVCEKKTKTYEKSSWEREYVFECVGGGGGSVREKEVEQQSALACMTWQTYRLLLI